MAGERTLPTPRGAGVIRRLEMPYGEFERRIGLSPGHYELSGRELAHGCLTLTLRKPVSPARVLDCYHALIWILRWIVVPALALPVAAHLVSKTPRPFRRWPYWLAASALLLLAVWVPLKLLDWIPKVSGFSAEATSFVLRSGAGYLLFVAALLALEFLTSAGKPRESQPSTAVSP